MYYNVLDIFSKCCEPKSEWKADLGDGEMAQWVKAFTTQAWWPQFNPQYLFEKSGMDTYSINSSAEGVWDKRITGASWSANLTEN